MQRSFARLCLFALAIPINAFALTPAIPDAAVVVYARRNLEAVGNELKAAAIDAGWQCERPVPANPLAQNHLVLECKSPNGQGHLVADDFADPLDRVSVQGYADAANLDSMLRILREFVRRVPAIPNARILSKKAPE